MHDTTIEIAATPDAVWAVLSDVTSWPAWDSGVTSVDGTLALGERITVSVAANPGRSFPLEVTELHPPHRMVWTGGRPLGLFRGERTYTVEPVDGGGSRFRMTERFSGLLAGLITRRIPDLQPSFDRFAAGLRATVEAD
ncbi:MAG: SRPBCC domain-containing protein [Actinomycetota bacterium]